MVDGGLAGGLRAWLEDVAAAAGRDGGGADLPGRGRPAAQVVVRDGALVSTGEGGRLRPWTLSDLRSSLTRTIFRLVTTGAALRHPLDDALCALSVTDRGDDVLEMVRRLGGRDRAALRAFARARASSIQAQWRPVPPAWLPRTGERLRVPLAGGAVSLTSTADLVVGRPSDGRSSVCLVRLPARGAPGVGDAAARTRRALALAETLRSGAPPLRVATYDPRTGQVACDEADGAFLTAAVLDVVGALERR